MHPALQTLRNFLRGSPYSGRTWLVGGAVRDRLLGLEDRSDFDLVTLGDAPALAEGLFAAGLTDGPPVTYARFGTAMVRLDGAQIELATARRESYDRASRKPDVQPATIEEDARRRDFTVNALMQDLESGDLIDPLGTGRGDLEARVLRTPQDPTATFRDDPLRMLRAVRFRWRLGFSYADGLAAAIRASASRLQIVSRERIRDELLKMLEHRTAPEALRDLMDLDLIARFWPELVALVDCEQGRYHHLDVWEHSLLVLRNVGVGDPELSLAALLHDVGKPATRRVDEQGQTRFFGHEHVGADLTAQLMDDLRFPLRVRDVVVRLVRNHMRLGSSPTFSPSAARRVWRDLGEDTPRLLRLVEADTLALRPGVKAMDLAPIRARLEEVRQTTSPRQLESPLTGGEVMALLGLEAGPAVGRAKAWLTERVLDGDLAPGDAESARRLLVEHYRAEPDA